MTFNVRQMDGDDGEHAWEHRKDVLVETINLDNPDLIGTQEIFLEQARYILEKIPRLKCFGRGRFGDNTDKHNSIFYDRDRFSLLESGESWFSETPHVPGSSSWDIPRPRMVTWGRLAQTSGPDVLILNTHMPYGRGADEARRQSARIILQNISALPNDLPLFLVADFNAPADGEIYAMLTANLQDAWKTAKSQNGPEGTIHGFGKFTGSKRIDWVLHRNAGETLQAETITHTANGLYPSDHYPVSATFLMK